MGGEVAEAPRDWGYEAQQAAEKRLEVIGAWEEYFEMGGDHHEAESVKPEGEYPAIAPYCGCTTCMVREALDAAWPVIEAGVRSGDFDPPAGE